MGELVLAGSCSGKFFAFARDDGELAWSYDSGEDGPPANFHGDALLAGDRLVVGSDARAADGSGTVGHLYCFSPTDGSLWWKLPVDGGVVSAMVERRGIVYGVTSEGRLLAVLLASGELLWDRPPLEAGAASSLNFSVLRHGDMVVHSSAGGLAAYAADDGEARWELALASPVQTTLVAPGQLLWVGTQDGKLHGVAIGSGELRATVDLGGMPYGSPVPDDEHLLLLLEGNTLARVDLRSGDRVWGVVDEHGWSSFRPLLDGELVWVGSEDGRLVGLDRRSGELAQELAIGGTVRGFTRQGEAFYVGTLGGTLHAIRAPGPR